MDQDSNRLLRKLKTTYFPKLSRNCLKGNINKLNDQDVKMDV